MSFLEVAYLLDSNNEPLTRVDLVRILRIAEETWREDEPNGGMFDHLMNAIVEDAVNTKHMLKDAKVMAHLSTPRELNEKR